jgi:hypothetical protein
LAPAVLSPAWVSATISSAEEWARSAVSAGVVDGANLYRFHRDAF